MIAGERLDALQRNILAVDADRLEDDVVDLVALVDGDELEEGSPVSGST